MGMFSNLMGKIFAHATPQTAAAAPAPASEPTPAAGLPAASPLPAIPAEPTPVAVDTGEVGLPAAAPRSVDVTGILDDLKQKSSESLDWKKSIVDMLKLLGMDSSLTARKELATELGYPGDEHDSATMNGWLHKAVLQKLADNGGQNCWADRQSWLPAFSSSV